MREGIKLGFVRQHDRAGRAALSFVLNGLSRTPGGGRGGYWVVSQYLVLYCACAVLLVPTNLLWGLGVGLGGGRWAVGGFDGR